MNRSSLKVPALLLALTLMWGTNWALFRVALDELPVLTFRSGRAGERHRHAGPDHEDPRRELRRSEGTMAALILSSTMNVGIWNIATSMAVLYLPSGHASVLAYTMPLWVALIGFVVFRQRLHRACWPRSRRRGGRGGADDPQLRELCPGAARPVLGSAGGGVLGDRHLRREAHRLGRHGPRPHLLAGRPHLAADRAGHAGDRRDGPRTAVDARRSRSCSTPAACRWPSARWSGSPWCEILPTQVAALSSIAIPIVADRERHRVFHEPLSALQAVAIASTVISLWLALVPRRSV